MCLCFSLIFLEFQYKVIHLLTSIQGEIETIGKKYEGEESTFYLTQLDDIGEFRKLDQEFRDHGNYW